MKLIHSTKNCLIFILHRKKFRENISRQKMGNSWTIKKVARQMYKFLMTKNLSIRIWFALLFKKQSFALLNHAIQTFNISFIDFSTLAWNPFRIFIHDFLMPSLTYQGSCDTCWKIDVLSFNMQKNEKNSYFPMKKSWPLLLFTWW